MSDSLILRLMRFVPKNLLSRLFGWVARLERPRWLVRRLNRFWVDQFDVDLDEAERPIEEYRTLLAFFTRRLKDGVRPISDDVDALVDPVDGRVGAFGRVEDGRLFQAKGMDYSLAALLGSAEAAAPFLNGHYATFYLSPRDYHHIHAPTKGRIPRSLYEPGTLWPVNGPAVRTVPSLFAVNERVTTWIDTERGPIAVCMVGATNVGSIRLAYADFVTNQGGRRAELAHQPALKIERGDTVGTFELGSTVVLLVGKPKRDASFEWEGLEDGAWRPFGGVVGRYRDVY